jgi:two-component system phosphate regulon response regulator PhoB
MKKNGGADPGRNSKVIHFKKEKQSARRQKTHRLRIAASSYRELRCMLVNSPDLILFNVLIEAKEGKAVLNLVASAFRMEDVQMAVTRPGASNHIVSNAAHTGCSNDNFSATQPGLSLLSITAVLSKQHDHVSSTSFPDCKYDVVIHPGRREVSINGRALSLSYTEFEIMRFLAENPYTVCTPIQILEVARGHDHNTQEKTVAIHIMNLRRKLGKARQLIETVKHVGYRINTNCTILS